MAEKSPGRRSRGTKATSGRQRDQPRKRDGCGRSHRPQSVIRVVLGAPLLLAPHPVIPSVHPLEEPRSAEAIPMVLVSYEAYCDTMHLIAEAGVDELAWLGAVRELGGARYLIEQIFLFRQRVHPVKCELDTDATGAFVHELLCGNPDARALVPRLRFWGHLHPVDPEPSLLDEETMRVFTEAPWFIRGIFSRIGRAHFTFFDYCRKVKVVDCPWGIAVADDGRRAAIAAEVREKVVRVRTRQEVFTDESHVTNARILGLPEASPHADEHHPS